MHGHFYARDVKMTLFSSVKVVKKTYAFNV